MNVFAYFFETVEFVGPCPLFGQVFRGIIICIHHIKNSLLNIRKSIVYARVTQKVGACEAAIPSPIVFAVSSCMYTYVSPACLYISFKGSFLQMVQHVPGCTEENYSSISLQAVI